MTILIAHRGASSEAPENTLKAIKRAIDLRVEFIEMDLHITKDNVPVVIHDPKPTRTTNLKKPARVETLTLQELKKLDAGSWFSPAFAGETIPTLEEVLDLDFHGVQLMLEIKKSSLPVDELMSLIYAVLAKKRPSAILGSFEKEIVQSLLQSDYPVIGIIEKPEMIKTFLDMGLKHLALWSRIMEPGLVRTLQEQGVKIWVFTIDDCKKAQFLRSLGVDGIITNNPQKIRKGFTEI